MERRAYVLADEGIAKRLPPETWDGVIALLLSGLKNKNLAEGFCAAIEKCGSLLEQHFPKELSSNSAENNQIQNHLIIKN